MNLLQSVLTTTPVDFLLPCVGVLRVDTHADELSDGCQNCCTGRECGGRILLRLALKVLQEYVHVFLSVVVSLY